jgi:hypothetical protein
MGFIAQKVDGVLNKYIMLKSGIISKDDEGLLAYAIMILFLYLLKPYKSNSSK